MGDGDLQELPLGNLASKRPVPADCPQEYLFAMELEIAVPHQGTGQQPRLAEYLKAIAHPEHQTAIGGKLLDRLHYRAEPGDRPATQVIPVAEASRHNYGICRAEHGIFVPNQICGMAHDPDGMDAILVAIGGRKLKNGPMSAWLRSKNARSSADRPAK